jgi:hypothetical protein
LAPVPKGFFFPPTPWHVWKINRDNQTRYVVLLREPPMGIPGGSSACIQVFESSAKRIGSWSFNTGWRRDVAGASIAFSNDLASYLIVLQMFAIGPDVSNSDAHHFTLKAYDEGKEYFALKDDQLKFIRMEDDKGNILQNDYVYSNIQVGFVPTATSTDQWIALLASKDKTDVLSALLFLGGEHTAKPNMRFPDIPWQSEYAPLISQVKKDRFIREWVRRKSQSDDTWIRQAALLAARK